MDATNLDQTTLLIIIGTIALVVGILLGRFLSHGTSSAQQNLEKELSKTKAELETYKTQVTEHFSKTAELVNNMTESYRDVYQHLASSAEQLGANEQFKLRLETSSPTETALTEDSLNEDSNTASTDKPTEAVDSPKDYAPKTDPDEAGTLSEDYGLKKTQTDSEAEGDSVNETPSTEKQEAAKS